MGWAALSELVPYYPLYALLFLDTGLSEAQISVLFALWSITAFVAEVPTGALADRWSRRGVAGPGRLPAGGRVRRLDGGARASPPSRSASSCGVSAGR